MALRLQPHQAALAHEQSLSLDERRRTGTVYTPAHLVEFVLDLAGYTPDSAIETYTLLDPACGCGAFLEHVIRRLVERWRVLHAESDADALLETIENNVVGVDKDDRAARLAAEWIRHTVGEILDQDVGETFFQANVTRSDFLDAPDPQLDLFRPHRERRFDFIVGNPPYVTTTRLSDDEKHRLRSRFHSAHGRIDLYSLFFERALELLADGGTLAFITPDKFLTSESAAPLRKLIATQGEVRAIARFRSHRTFDGAATVPCVTVVHKGSASGSTIYMECNGSSSGDRIPRVDVFSRREVTPPPPSGQAWHFLDPELHRIAGLLTKGKPTLEQMSRRISAGIATGRDGIYVVPSGSDVEIETELLHPCLRGQDLAPFKISASGARIIIPYVHEPDVDPRLADLRKYPETRAYLEAHREDLESRHCVRKWGKSWFDIHDPWTLNVTGEPKILFPDVANSNRFVFDEGNYCPLHSAYYVIPQGVDPEYLTTLLNSSVAEFLIRLHAPLVKDGFSRYRKQFVKTLPVPELARRERRTIIKLATDGDMLSMNARVAHLFGLSSREALLVENFVLEARGERGADESKSSKAA